MKKTYRVSVKYKSGPLAGKFVVQTINVSYKIACELYDIWTLEGYEVLIIQMNCINVSYKIACELYDIWTLEGYEVLIIQMNCRKPNLQKKWLYKPKKNRRRQNEL